MTAPTPKPSLLSRFWQKLKDFPLYFYVVCYLASRDAVDQAERIVSAYWGPRKAS